MDNNGLDLILRCLSAGLLPANMAPKERDPPLTGLGEREEKTKKNLIEVNLDCICTL